MIGFTFLIVHFYHYRPKVFLTHFRYEFELNINLTVDTPKPVSQVPQ